MAIFGKLAYADGVTPETLVLIRFTAAAGLLATLLALRPGLRVTRPVHGVHPVHLRARREHRGGHPRAR